MQVARNCLVLLLCIVMLLSGCSKEKRFANTGLRNSPLTAAVASFADTVVLSGIRNTDLVLNPSFLYLVDGKFYMNNGSVLIIPAGCRIEGLYKSNMFDASTIVITRNSQIIAKGKQSNPIVFTSSLQGLPDGRTIRQPGDWGGIIILGNAPTNIPSPVRQTSPAGPDPALDLTYGGADTEHNGGIMTFCRIEYAGAPNFIAPGSESGSLVCVANGKKTALRYIQSSFSAGCAFQFLGGNIAPKYLLANAPLQSCFDFEYGYTGDFQFGIGIRKEGLAYNNASGIECDNDPAGSANTPRTRPLLSNITIVGHCSAAGGLQQGALWRRGTDLRIRNSVIMGYPVGTVFDNTNPANAALFFRSNGVHGFTDTALFTGSSVAPWGIYNLGITGTMPADWLNNPCPAAHATYKSSALVYKAGGLFDPAIPGGVDTSFAGMTTNFLRVPYIGALGPGSPFRENGVITIPNNWIAGSAGAWVDIDPD